MAAAGGWGYFDKVGLHIYHDDNPYEDSYNNGIFSSEVQQVVDSINKNGGGKGIWVTEFGYDSDKYGLDNQTNWTIESMKIMRGMAQVEKVFIYRLFDKGNGLGLVNSSFSPKPVYEPVKNFLSGNYTEPAVVAEEESSVEETTEEESPAEEPAAEESNTESSSSIEESVVFLADKEKTEIRVDGNEIIADGSSKY